LRVCSTATVSAAGQTLLIDSAKTPANPNTPATTTAITHFFIFTPEVNGFG
jgi:hypothetical protein